MSTTSYCNGAIQLHDGVVARLEINRPGVCNAITAEMWETVGQVAVTVGSSNKVKVLVICGAGKHFSAGADISEFSTVYASSGGAVRYNATFVAAEAAIRGIPQPVIAQIRGACFGGGLGLALAADFHFADTTSFFAITASKLGIAYSPEDTARLVEKVGVARAKDLLFSARTLRSEEALSFGLVDRVFEPEKLAAQVDAYANDLAMRSCASLTAMKTMFLSLASPDPEKCDLLRPVYMNLFAGADLKEGYKAFLQKRDPVFG